MEFRRIVVPLAVALVAALALPAPARADFDAALAEALDSVEVYLDEQYRAGSDGDGTAGTTTAAELNALLAAAVAAGEAEGLEFEKIGRHAAYHAMRRFGRDVPEALQGPRGYLDMDILLIGATGRSLSPAEGSGRSYLSAISSEGSRTRTEGVRASVDPRPAEAEAEQPAAGDAEEPTVESRIVNRGGQSYIRIAPGDTLSRLALEVYGDALAYRRIYIANRDRIRNPNLLTPGMEFVIPR